VEAGEGSNSGGSDWGGDGRRLATSSETHHVILTIARQSIAGVHDEPRSSGNFPIVDFGMSRQDDDAVDVAEIAVVQRLRVEAEPLLADGWNVGIAVGEDLTTAFPASEKPPPVR